MRWYDRVEGGNGTSIPSVIIELTASYPGCPCPSSLDLSVVPKLQSFVQRGRFLHDLDSQEQWLTIEPWSLLVETQPAFAFLPL
jgi:hypothetical protein